MKINMLTAVNYLHGLPEINGKSQLSKLLGVDGNFYGRLRGGTQTGQKPEIKARVVDALYRRTKRPDFGIALDLILNKQPRAKALKIIERNCELEANFKKSRVRKLMLPRIIKVKRRSAI